MDDLKTVLESREVDLDVTPNDFFLAIWDDSSTLVTDVHLAVHKSIDFTFPLWQEISSTENERQLERKFSFDLQLPKVPMAPSKCTINAHWTCLIENEQQCSVKQISRTVGVMYSDNYEVHSLFKYERGDNQKGQITISVEIVYFKTFMMQGLLEKYTIQGVKDYAKIFLEKVEERLQQFILKKLEKKMAETLANPPESIVEPLLDSSPKLKKKKIVKKEKKPPGKTKVKRKGNRVHTEESGSERENSQFPDADEQDAFFQTRIPENKKAIPPNIAEKAETLSRSASSTFSSSTTYNPNGFTPNYGIGLGLALGTHSSSSSNALMIINPNRGGILTRSTFISNQLEQVKSSEILEKAANQREEVAKGGAASDANKPRGSGKDPAAAPNGINAQKPNLPDKSAKDAKSSKENLDGKEKDKEKEKEKPKVSRKELEMVSHIGILMAKHLPTKSGTSIIFILLITQIILILFCFYLFNEVQTLRAALAAKNP